MTNNTPCPCGNIHEGQALLYAACCEPFINGTTKPAHCEQLMRSRYTAYSFARVDYLMATWHPNKQPALDRQDLAESAEKTEWMRLEIVKSSQQGEQGIVEFIAWFKDKGINGDSQRSEIKGLHEVSRFEKVGGQWFYVDGDVASTGQLKVGRNDPCPCGSDKKFKKCCA
ncbi:YchJ family protein [Alkalimarinus alittae]|uniref:UPF0225 protein NKI27_12105 n=1 Tax=Alkalimarinus alittae TaxID=2961619 RepID=A0ABY6MYB2_9ALTE|nr:YchJ family protein [Alkalimarinus alittae]UZE94820.1 YchJ family protein [Alkalimarinus alittae]